MDRGIPPGSARIFVQIPAYRDNELGRTLVNLYRMAEHPERLRTVVLWQKAPEDKLPRDVYELPNLTILESPYQLSRGPNWARHLIQAEAGGEEFTLLLDSHHRFSRGWDELALHMHASLQRAGVSKPLLTAYLPSYIPGGGSRARRRDASKIYPWKRDQGILTRLISYPIYNWQALDQPVSAEYLSLHFIFARAEFNREIAFDPDIYFFGDEVATSMRAYTHGWDMFHPHRIIGWHAYSRATRQPHWETHPEWRQVNQDSLDQLRALFTESPHRRRLVGCQRSVGDYEAFIMHQLVEPR
ncbi:GlcNAc-transferase family protein [Arthrobacter sp. ok362]|uniref:GlcNAc-transferase family protein n=1 Tax=Arthrobacter sp. ok362 TaxID=1761745 RepID=UPI00088E0AE0|nr:GlcNAc-transferase family protein [Arthrobacter sp. ok362]SDL40175.1 Glycosyltransferase (GlcNAc) [Arthrobacter sp. ok362]